MRDVWGGGWVHGVGWLGGTGGLYRPHLWTLSGFSGQRVSCEYVTELEEVGNLKLGGFLEGEDVRCGCSGQCRKAEEVCHSPLRMAHVSMWSYTNLCNTM